MKIWYVHPSAGGPGLGRYWRAYYFAKHWKEAGNQVLVFSSSYHHLLEPNTQHLNDEVKDGVHYVFVPTIKYVGNGSARKLSMLLFSVLLAPYSILRAIKNGKPDVIIYSSPHPFGYMGAWMASKILRSKLVFEVRDIWPLSLVELADMNPNSLVVRLTGWIEKFAYRASDKVVSLLPCAKEHMVERGMNEHKFSWIPNGVGRSDTKMQADGAIEPLEQRICDLREQGNFVVIYAGALGEPNSIHTLLEAFKILDSSDPTIKLILVGRGVLREELLGQAERDRLSNVEFHDQIDKAQIMRVLSRASAGYISLKPQPIFRFGISPNKLWDYMLAKLPVIFACRAANNPVEDYQCGISVDPTDPISIADGIREMAKLPREELEKMGESGYRVVLQDYEYQALSKRYETELLSLMRRTQS